MPRKSPKQVHFQHTRLVASLEGKRLEELMVVRGSLKISE